MRHIFSQGFLLLFYVINLSVNFIPYFRILFVNAICTRVHQVERKAFPPFDKEAVSSPDYIG